MPSPASLFRDFSFDAAPTPASRVHDADRAAMTTSPTSQARNDLHRPDGLVAAPPCPMADLTAQFGQHTLGRNSSCPMRPSTPPPTDSPTGSPTGSRAVASLIRMQRQSHSRMQCSASHARDLSALVRMMEQQEQCTHFDATKSRTGSASSSTSSSSSSDEDALDMDATLPQRNVDTLAAMPAWRAGEREDGCVRVVRITRMRRRAGNGVVKRRTL